MAESEQELKSLLMKVKEESEKSGWKLNIQKTKIMASGPITPWQIDVETMETVTDFIFLGSKITADEDCRHEIKRRLFFGRKAMANLDNILKSRDITLLTKACLVEAMVFPVVMYGCESWAIKIAEHWRIDAFEVWCWRRLLRVPWTARRSNKSILKKIRPEYSLEGLMLKLKLQYFGHLMGRTKLLEKRWTEKPGVLQSMGLPRVRHDWATELNWSVQLSDVKYIYNVVTTIITIHFQNFFIILIKSLYPLNNNSSLPAPGNLYSAFCLYEFVDSRYLMWIDLYNT